MDDKDWMLLQLLSEEKNITKTADRLYLSQPAVSQRIKNLEREFAAKILYRNVTGVAFTPQGEALLSYAQKMLLELRDTKEKVLNMEGQVQGTLRLGTSSIFAHYELPDILKGFRDRYSNVEVSLKTGLSHVVNRSLQKGDIAVAILRGDYPWSEERVLLRDEPICLVSAYPIQFTDLPNLPQISYGTDGALRTTLDEWWHQSFSRPPFNPMEVDTMDTCRQLVLKGMGWALLPEIGLREHDKLFTKELYWRNGKPLRRKTWMAYRYSSCELSAVRAFIEYIKECYMP